jgi:hypothetical protein
VVESSRSMYIVLTFSVSNPLQIWIQHFRLNTDPDPGFWWTKNGKNLQLKKYASEKDVHTTEEAFSPQKRISALQKQKYLIFFYFCGSFLPFRIRIHWWLNPDPIRIRNTTRIRVKTYQIKWRGSRSGIIVPNPDMTFLKENLYNF